MSAPDRFSIERDDTQRAHDAFAATLIKVLAAHKDPFFCVYQLPVEAGFVVVAIGAEAPGRVATVDTHAEVVGALNDWLLATRRKP